MESMQAETMSTNHLYQEIQMRTGGEIYIGVVGPVRTGKSTFIKRFMDVAVLPYMDHEAEKMRAQDEMPQSAGGKTVTTTEPKFIPQKAASLTLSQDVKVKVRLIDCVGFMVDGAAGHLEEGMERMVKTPWYETEIPFTQAAEIGTRKVITDHSGIGLVITTDGSFGELKREAYIAAEEKAIAELKKLQKPFMVLVNSAKPHSETALKTAAELTETYHVTAMPVNCQQLTEDDVRRIMEKVLYEFPVTRLEFYMPKWVELLPVGHKVKTGLISRIREYTEHIHTIRDVLENPAQLQGSDIKRSMTEAVNMADGSVRIILDMQESCYYEMLSELAQQSITSERQLADTLRELADMKKEYIRVLHAMEAVRSKGYGVVMPTRSEIRLKQPEVIRHGSKFGVKIKAESPSLHFIRANVVTEIAPIVGTEQQAKDLIGYIDENGKKDGIWETNIFGKTVEELVKDGIQAKISMIGEESQQKLQDTMQKIVNDSTGGMVCIII